MVKSPETYRPNLYQVLSIDVVLGTLAVGSFAVRLLGVSPQPVWWFVLPLAVWSVYTLDHLLDGLRLGGTSSIFRHRYHYEHSRPLFIAVAAAGVTALTLSLWQFEPAIITGGLLLGLVVLLYLAAQFFLPPETPFVPKELIIALVYVGGVVLAPVIWYGKVPSTSILVIFTALILLAWCEGTLASWFEIELDRQDGQRSFSLFAGKQTGRRVVMGLLTFMFAALLLLTLVTREEKLRTAFLIEAIMAALLLSILAFPAFFARNRLYRWIGEAVFLLPAAIYLF
jgi:hypothetical protein